MLPHPAFNWLCVLCSTANILTHATRIRAAQLAPAIITQSSKSRSYDQSKSIVRASTQRRADQRDWVEEGADKNSSEIRTSLSEGHRWRTRTAPEEPAYDASVLATRPLEEESPRFDQALKVPSIAAVETMPFSENSSPMENSTADGFGRRSLQVSTVPSSRVGRLFHYGGLAASMGYGLASEMLRRSSRPALESEASMMMSEPNVKRLVEKLSKMRGAALKVGQFLSIQDTHVLPPAVDEVLRRVQDSAHYMPDWQMEKVLTHALGPDWSTHFTSFTRIPFAAASIGQVHSAILSPSSSPTGKAAKVAVKIQFPNIADSIASDLGYVKLLLMTGRLLPKGLFLDRTIQVMKQELVDECDYKREASFLRAFASPSYLGDDAHYKVPWVWDGSTDRVLVMEHVEGLSVGDAKVNALSQQDRDDIAARVIELCLKELFQFRLMQTDPNWTNFLWNAQTRQLGLVDFGATREYSKAFMDKWLHLLLAAAADDKDGCIEWSLKLGYLTGDENEIMLDAHVTSMTLLATPFKITTAQPFAFGRGTAWADCTAKIRGYIPVMLKNRLTPPPRETYSLNRKLSGAFLLASRLGAVVHTKSLWDGIIANYRFDP